MTLLLGWSHADEEPERLGPPFAAGLALEDSEWGAARGRRDVARSERRGLRLWSLGRPDPRAQGLKARRATQDGYAIVQCLNEPNLCALGKPADVEEWPGSAEDAAAWLGAAIDAAGDGHRIALTPFSPGVGPDNLRAWLAAHRSVARECVALIAHVYGDAVEMWGALEPVLDLARALKKPVWIGECGPRRDQAAVRWGLECLPPFAERVARTAPEVEVLCVFAPIWTRPDPGFTNPALAGTAVERWMAEWVPPATEVLPVPVNPRAELEALARVAAAKYRLDWPLLDRQVIAESNWNPRAVSRSGAKGLMQLMDATARLLGVTDPFDPAQNLEGGCRYLRFLLDKYRSYEKALVAFNWGPGNLDRLLATNPPDWRVGISAQAKRYLEKIRPPREEAPMAAGNDGPRARTLGAVIHSTRSGVERSLEDEAEKTAAWMRQGAPNPSCHKVISPTRAIEVVPKALAAWHARDPLNQTHLGYELAQPFPHTPYHPGQYKLLAKELVEDARAFNFPLVRVASGNATPGLIGHEDTANGRADGKSDPGALFDWAQLLREINALVKKPFNVAAERDLVWAIAENLEANGYPWYGQGLKALTAANKGEK